MKHIYFNSHTISPAVTQKNIQQQLINTKRMPRILRDSSLSLPGTVRRNVSTLTFIFIFVHKEYIFSIQSPVVNSDSLQFVS